MKGFTLIELLLVIVIIGVLAAAVVPRLAGRTQQAKITRASADIEGNLGLALDLYEMDNGAYPTTEQGLTALVTKPTSPPIPENWRGPYLKKSLPRDPWNCPYKYICPGIQNKNDYDLYSLGPDGLEGTKDDIKNWHEESPANE